MKNYRITLAIATYNRKNIVEMFSENLKGLMIENIQVRIYDDKSNEYDLNELKMMFPYASEIVRRNENLKADKNMYMIYKDFLEKEDDYLIQLDSDMLIGKNFFEMVYKIIETLEKNEQVFSLYNSSSHEYITEENFLEINQERFFRKEHIGAACVIFSRKTVFDIIKNIPIQNNDFSNFDWRWSKYLKDNNIPIYVSEKSYVQHIGIGGQNNNRIKNLDLGRNFIGIDNIVSGNFLIKYYEHLLNEQDKYIKNMSFIEYLKIKYKKNKIIYKLYMFIKNKGSI